MVWLVKEALMTKDGCPEAQPRFTSRPSARRMTFLPSGQMNSSTCGLTVSRLILGSPMMEATSISRSKCPMLHTIAPDFMASRCLRRMMSRQPVAVMKMSPLAAASSMVTTS